MKYILLHGASLLNNSLLVNVTAHLKESVMDNVVHEMSEYYQEPKYTITTWKTSILDTNLKNVYLIA